MTLFPCPEGVTVCGDLCIVIASFLSLQVPIVKERRRFNDVLDEEAELRYQRKMEAWGRDDFSVYKPARVLGEGATTGEGEDVTQEVISSSVSHQASDECPGG